MGCNCGKPKCDGHCGVSPAVLQINNPSECVLFRKVEVPASMGTSVENPPKPGAYRNVLLYYNADGEAYLYSSDGMPTKVTGTTSNYEILTNKPKINGVELVGDKSLADIGVTDAIDNALENYTPTSGFAEVAFTGDYEDLVNTPPKVVSHFYTLSLDRYDVGDEVPVYNDEGMTDRTTYEQFADAIVKGPVQFNQQYDVGSYNISGLYLITADVEYDIGFSVEDTPGGNQRTEMLWNKGDSMPVIEYIRPSYTQVNADWNTTNTSSPAYIKNKPSLATVATSGSYDDLTDKPDIPSGLHVFHMGPASVGNTAPIYHDYEKTNQVTLAQFIDAIASGPVQIYKAYDTRSFLIYYVDPIDAFIPDPPQYTGTLYANFGLRDPYGLGVKRFSWYEPDTAPTYDSYDANQSDWNETSPTNSSYILNKPSLATVATSGSYNDLSNKPTIPAAQVNSDWNASSGVAQILNKPTLAAVATSGSYNDLSNKPTIPAAQVNSDWNAASGVAQILNKPSLATVATSGSYNDLTNKPTIPTVNNATLTIQKNGTDVQTFTANQSTNATANITVPTKTSDLTNDGATGASVYIEESDIAPSELSGEGELITLNGTTDCSILDTQLLGNAEQTTYSGKNLINTNALSRTLPYASTSRGITFTLAADGSITLNGKNDGTGNSTFQIYNGTTPLVLVGGNYTGDLNPSDGVYRAVNMMSYDGTSYRSFRQNSMHALTANNYTIYLQVNSGETTQFSSYEIYPMLEAGTTKSPYEPYVGSVDGSLTPSPNPSYPQPISTVTGEQTVQVTGKNLWGGFTAFSSSSGDIDFTNNADGSVTASGTATSNTSSVPNVSVATSNNWFITLPSGGYIASAGTLPSGIQLQIYDANTGANIANAQGQFTLTEQTQVYARIRVASGTTVNATFNIQIERGSATAYEPYQAQSYEINLGKNLFSVAFDSGGSTPASDTNAFTLTKPSTRTKMFNFPTALTAGTYTFSFNITSDTTSQSSTTGGVRFQLVGSGGVISGTSSVAIGTGTKSKTWTVSEPVYAIYFYINSSEADDVSVAMTDVMLERGSTPTSYASYFTPIELAKVGDYQDRIYENDGKWYIEKQVGKVVLTGANTENWQYTNNVCYTDSISDYSRSDNKPLSDNFTTTVNVASAGSVADNTSAFGGANLGTQNRFYVKYTSIFSSAATIETWLASHNTTIYYALDTSTTTEITNETLIGQLEALAGALGYDGVTNIISTSPGLPAILSVSTYTGSAIPSATRARAGIVRIGDGIDVDDCGTISVNAQKAPTAFTMQYADNLAGWQAGDNYELVKETTGSPTDYIYRANKFYYGGADVSFLNEKTGVVFTPQELYAWLLDGNEAVLNHVPLGWAVNNDAEVLDTGNYIDGIWLKRETIASQSGNVISFNGSAFVTAFISRANGYERVQDTLGIAISGYEEDGAMVYDLISIDGFSLYGSVQESSPII